MRFKYIKDYNKLIGASEKQECKLCKTTNVCYDGICKNCLDNQEQLKQTPEEFKSLYSVARPEEIRKQLKEINPNWDIEKIEQISKQRDNEIEYGTPSLNGYQGFQWPCLDGDYCQFIAFGCKPFYNSLSKTKNGKEVFDQSLHYEIREDYISDNWKEYWEEYVPDEMIESSDEADYATLFFVFKSLHSDKIITYIDSM